MSLWCVAMIIGECVGFVTVMQSTTNLDCECVAKASDLKSPALAHGIVRVNLNRL